MRRDNLLEDLRIELNNLFNYQETELIFSGIKVCGDAKYVKYSARIVPAFESVVEFGDISTNIITELGIYKTTLNAEKNQICITIKTQNIDFIVE